MANTVNAKCGICGQTWPVCDLPQPLSKVAKLMKAARCPNGCAGQVFLADAASAETSGTDTTPAAIAAMMDGVTPPSAEEVEQIATWLDDLPCCHDDHAQTTEFCRSCERPVASALRAIAAERDRLAKELASAQRGRDEWRDDFKALAAAIVGDTGLSAMTVAAQARLYRPRAEKAEAENERLRAAMRKIDVGEGWAALIARAAMKGETP